MMLDIIIDTLQSEANKSTCIRRKVSALLVSDDKIIVRAHNGNSINPCSKDSCIRNKLRALPGTSHSLCYGIHAEINLILCCLAQDINITNSIIYCTHSPCIDCATVISAYNLKCFYYLYDYPDKRFMQIFETANISYGSIFT